MHDPAASDTDHSNSPTASNETEGGSPAQLAVAPTSSAAEGVVRVTGTGCPIDASWGNQHWEVLVRTSAAGEDPTPGRVQEPSPDGEHLSALLIEHRGDDLVRAKSWVTPRDDGSWESALHLPADMPPDRYQIEAVCLTRSGLEHGYVTYPSAALDIS